MRKLALISFIHIVLIAVAASSAKGQIDSIKYPTKILRGYFLLYRSEIINLDADNTPARNFYEVFYSPILNDSLINGFVGNIADDTTSYICIAHPFNETWYNDEIHDRPIWNYIEKNIMGFKELSAYSAFKKPAMQIPSVLEKSNERFISVFYGELLVVGPFDTSNPINRLASKKYLYLKDDRNHFKLCYSLLLSNRALLENPTHLRKKSNKKPKKLK